MIVLVAFFGKRESSLVRVSYFLLLSIATTAPVLKVTLFSSHLSYMMTQKGKNRGWRFSDKRSKKGPRTEIVYMQLEGIEVKTLWDTNNDKPSHQ